MISVGASKIGLVRKFNEDKFYMGENFWLIADGMGGYKGGEIASSIAIDDISQALISVEHISEEKLIEVVISVNGEILRRVKNNYTLKGMGTTTIIGYVENNKLYWANVGDSRLYVLRNEKLQQISKDHSLVQSLIDNGEITEEQRISYPNKNYLTRAVGVLDFISVDTGTFPLLEGDRLLLCSDGLSSYVANDQIEKIMNEYAQDDNLVLEKLFEAVYESGAKDNVSIILVRI